MKYLDKSNLKEKGCVMAHISREDRVCHEAKAWQQRHEASLSHCLGSLEEEGLEEKRERERQIDRDTERNSRE